MNLQQLEYIIAVDAHRHFATAAEKCFVTQPTLSMMIQKLEDELGVKIFDRNKQPVMPTEIGSAVISQAQKVVLETSRIKEMIAESKGELKGEFKLGIIPTIAPYLLPRFLKSFTEQYPLITLKISELTTSSLLSRLEQRQLDAAILASPISSPTINVYPLFFEKFMIYASANYKSKVHDFFKPADLDVNKLWLLQEGHCMRSQVLNLCDLKKQKKHTSTVEYEAGSIETLMRMVELNQGITIVPQLSLKNLDEKQLENIRHFAAPEPGREIVIVTNRHYIRERMIKVLKDEIVKSLPDEMKEAIA